MRITRKVLPLVLTVLGAACGEEKNPYTGNYQAGATTAAGTGSAATGTGSTNNTPGAPGVPTQQAAQDAKTVAKADSIPKAALAGVQAICAPQPALDKFKEEMAVLCLNGQATQAFANALAAPYKGGANPPLQLLKSEDVNRVSEFVALAVIEVPKTAMEVFAKRADLVTGTTTSTLNNATVTQAVVAKTDGGAGNVMGTMEVKFDLAVSVAIINVKNTQIISSESYALNPDKTVIATAAQLKAGDPNNTDDLLANSVSFFMQEGNVTKIISVNHQKANNQGQGAAAQTTVQGIGAATMTDTYNKLTK